jgi:hypothetical protein
VLSVTGGQIDIVEIVEDPANPIFATDPLLGGFIEVDDLILSFSEGLSHFFTGAQVRVIGSNGETYIVGDLGLFVSSDIPESEDGLLHSFGVLTNLLFPSVSMPSAWLEDVMEFLTAGGGLTLDLALMLDPEQFAPDITLASLITSSISAGTPFSAGVFVDVTLNGTPVSEPSTVVLFSIAAIACLGVLMGRRARPRALA